MKIALVLIAVLGLVGCATPGGDSRFVLECGDATVTCVMNVADRQSGVSTSDGKIVTDPDNVSVGKESEPDNEDAVIITDPDNVNVDASAGESVIRRALGVVQ